MEKKNKSINAGVHTNTGMEFQKHCALYILLDNYHNIKDKKYFIFLEHQEDLLFGYLNDEGKLALVDAYQAKKSSNIWNLSELYEIVKKIIANGVSLREDEIEKADDYLHNLHFITNNTISLKYKIKSPKQEITCLINETNDTVKYSSIDENIKKDIEDKLSPLVNGQLHFLKELENVTLRYIDFSKTNTSQKQHLIGMFGDIFGDKVSDHKAAIETLLLIFRDIENTFNQGGVARLDDESKRVESGKIEEAINIITTKTKAYELWRKKDVGISEKLGLTITDQQNFKMQFENSFDEFKDLTQAEHQKILHFTNANTNVLNTFVNEEDCIKHLYDEFKKTHNSQLSELHIKAAIFAAYIEIKVKI